MCVLPRGEPQKRSKAEPPFGHPPDDRTLSEPEQGSLRATILVAPDDASPLVAAAIVSLLVSLGGQLLSLPVAKGAGETRIHAACRLVAFAVVSRSFLAMQKVVGSNPIIRSPALS
jgi:hypothetical protein